MRRRLRESHRPASLRQFARTSDGKANVLLLDPKKKPDPSCRIRLQVLRTQRNLSRVNQGANLFLIGTIACLFIESDTDSPSEITPDARYFASVNGLSSRSTVAAHAAIFVVLGQNQTKRLLAIMFGHLGKGLAFGPAVAQEFALDDTFLPRIRFVRCIDEILVLRSEL